MNKETERKELIIDPYFSSICNKLTAEEFNGLESSVLEAGEILSPIITWNGIIIDGHHRYEIAKRHPEIPYKVEEMDFPDRESAVAWICDNQLGRRNISKRQYKYILGKEYETQKTRQNLHGNRYTKSDKGQSTRAEIAKRYGMKESQVKLAYMLYQGIEAADEVMPGMKNEILSGGLNPTDKEIYEIARLPKEERKKAVEKFQDEFEKSSISYQLFMAKRDDILMKFSKATKDYLAVFREYIEKYPQLLKDEKSSKFISANLESINKFFFDIYG